MVGHHRLEEPHSVEVVEVLEEPLEGCSKDCWRSRHHCWAEEEQADLLVLSLDLLSVDVSPVFVWFHLKMTLLKERNKDVGTLQHV